MSDKTPRAIVIGGGPAGLMAAQTMAQAGLSVSVYDHMPTLGRKFLLAGRGGLNLTHSENIAAFLQRYDVPDWMAPHIAAFPPLALRQWAEDLGEPTFAGTSGRIFPKSFKASPLLRAWLRRLAASGVTAQQLSGVTFAYDQTSDFGKATANFVHDQLKANLGVDITLQGFDTNTLSGLLASGDFQIAGPMGWTADYPDPADWYHIFLTSSSNNVAFYQNQQYDNFVRVARTDVQPARRDQEYQQAQQMLGGDAPVAFLAQSVSWFLVRPYVRGATTSPIDEWPGALFAPQISIAPH